MIEVKRFLDRMFAGFFSLMLSLKKKEKTQHDICELKFIWGKMRTIAQETAFQIALRNCSKEVEGKISIYVILVKEEYMQSSTA